MLIAHCKVFLFELGGGQHLDELRTGGDEPPHFLSVDRCRHQFARITSPKTMRPASIASGSEIG